MATKKVLGRGLGAFFPEYQEDGKETDAKSEGVEKNIVKPEDRVNIVLFVPVDHIRKTGRVRCFHKGTWAHSTYYRSIHRGETV